MDLIRLFIACELPETVKSGLVHIQEALQSVDPSCAKWVDPNSIHLTLKFLGYVDAEKVESITKGLFEAAGNIPPFQLELAGHDAADRVDLLFQYLAPHVQGST